MQPLLRFGLAAPPETATAGIEQLADALAQLAPVRLDPVFVADYDALTDAVTNGLCDLAWTPPLVAHALLRSHAAVPLVALGRMGGTSYYSAFAVLEDSPLEDVNGLAGKRVGWVSKLSAAGYVFPRMHLRSLGLDPATLFAEEIYAGSHEALGKALADGEVDVIATYATPDRATRELWPPELGVPLKLIAQAGPIPGDVIVAASSVPAATRRDVSRALLALRLEPLAEVEKLMTVWRFEPVPHNHFALLDHWLGRPKRSA